MFTSKILIPIALLSAAVTGILLYAAVKSEEYGADDEKDCDDDCFDECDNEPCDAMTDEEKSRTTDSIGY